MLSTTSANLALFALLPVLASAAPLSPRWSYLNNLSSNVRSSLESYINDDSTLAGAAARSARYFGNAWQSFYLATPGYSETLNAQFDCYTPENEMKWEVIQPEQGVFNWTGADIIFERARQTNSLVRVHNFCWSSQSESHLDTSTPSMLTALCRSSLVRH